MNYVYGAAAGIIWGALAAYINSRITKWALGKANQSVIMAMNVLHLLVDIAALAVVFFIRNILPFSFEATLIATAGALSIVTIVFTYRFTGNKEK